MTTIGKGDWVLCVRSDEAYGHRVIAGNAYYVTAIRRTSPGIAGLWDCDICGQTGSTSIDLAGFPVSPFWSWCACCLRPLSRGPGETAQRREKIGAPA